MIEYKNGNLLDVKEGVIIHGCNSKGVMGSGVALGIKRKYPECYNDYKHYCSNEPVALGLISWYKHNDFLWIANAITQETYGRDSNKRYVNYAAICSAFRQAINFCISQGVSLNFPMIGAGLGGGDWVVISMLIQDCDPKNKVKKICWIHND